MVAHHIGAKMISADLFIVRICKNTTLLNSYIYKE